MPCREQMGVLSYGINPVEKRKRKSLTAPLDQLLSSTKFLSLELLHSFLDKEFIKINPVTGTITKENKAAKNH